MHLQDVHNKLLAHFSSLSSERETEGYRVHAIEHGLSEEEIAALNRLLESHLAANRAADEKHWLAWIVAASEVGYGYDGVEYWDSFSAVFPSWTSFGNRNLIRTWFKRFSVRFKGHEPTGKWAEHFPIIAWPITHAILPKYLQFLFVDHLFDLRTALSRNSEMTLSEIGELLLERYYGSSSRFIGLLQQTALTSRIVLAMQMEDVSETTSPIDSTLLERIVKDVERRGRSGSRLRETRRVLRKSRFINSATKRDNQSIATGPRAEGVHGFIRPRVIARQIEDGNWQTSIVFPNLAEPLRKIGLSPAELNRSRMRYRIGGEGGSWSPARGLFGFDGQFEHQIHKLPDDGRLIELEAASAEIKAALADLTSLEWQFPVLMRLKSDGTASEVLGKHIKPDNTYIVLDKDTALLHSLSGLQPKDVCVSLDGVSAVQIDVPSSLDRPMVEQIAKLGFGYLVSAKIEPVGLSPRWDKVTGALVFGETDTPMFRISSDMSVEEYQITIDDTKTSRFKALNKSEVIVAIEDLDEGPHKISVAALRTASGEDLSADETDILIQTFRPWKQTIGDRAGISVWTEPPNSTINELLEKSAILRARIPHGRTAAVTMLYRTPDETVVREQSIGQLPSTATTDKIEGIVQSLGSERFMEDYERSSRVDLKLACGELGSSVLSFEKDVEPLRWIWIGNNTIRLSDDTDGDEEPRIEFYPLNAVDRASTVDYKKALVGVTPSGTGGLYGAVYNRKRYGVIVSCGERTHSDFRSLSTPVDLSSQVHHPIKLLNTIKHWSTARRLIGPMAFMAQRNAIRALSRQLETVLCGEDWVQKVSGCTDGNRPITDLYTAVNHSKGYASGLRRFLWHYDEDLLEAEREFIRLSKIYKICTDDKLCRLALRLAFAPHTVRKGDLPDKNALKLLQGKRRSLVRGAYYARLASFANENHNSSSEAA